MNERGDFGCDCPQGKFHRDRGPCKHVRFVQAGPAKVARLPSQDPARTVTTPPPVGSRTADATARLRNVKEVFAELRRKESSPPEPASPAVDAAGGLLSALDE